MRKCTPIALTLILGGLYGCNGDALQQEKREADRSALELEDAQRDRDADKAEIDQLKAQVQQLQDQLRDATAAKSATTEVAK